MATAVTNDANARARLTVDATGVIGGVNWSASVTDNSANFGGFGDFANLTITMGPITVVSEVNKTYDFGANSPAKYFPRSYGTTFQALSPGTYTATGTFSTTGLVGTASLSFSFSVPSPPNPAPSFTNQDITTTWIKTINFSAAPDRTVAASNASGYSIVASGTGLSPTAWLTINSSGQLSGVPTAVGVYTFLIRASGAGGTADSSLITLTVNPPGNRSNGTNMATDLVVGKRYDGTQWVNIGTFKRYNGTAWVDIVN